jgi:hypothetical protein
MFVIISRAYSQTTVKWHNGCARNSEPCPFFHGKTHPASIGHGHQFLQSHCYELSRALRRRHRPTFRGSGAPMACPMHSLKHGGGVAAHATRAGHPGDCALSRDWSLILAPVWSQKRTCQSPQPGRSKLVEDASAIQGATCDARNQSQALAVDRQRHSHLQS